MDPEGIQARIEARKGEVGRRTDTPLSPAELFRSYRALVRPAGKGATPTSPDIVLARDANNQPMAVARVQALKSGDVTYGFETTVTINSQQVVEWWRIDQTGTRLCDAQETLQMLRAAASDPALNPELQPLAG